MNNSPTILTIESSCDETAAAITRIKPNKSIEVLASVVSSQIDLHRQYGGVFPEIASRMHSIKIRPVVEEALKRANITLDQIDAIAVTAGPGLIGSLIVGVEFARTIAMATKKPLIALNHLEGHIYANFIEDGQPHFPLLALVVSGGHTLLIKMVDHLQYEIIGSTLDDAAGEAYDKVARMLNLPYPGGPSLEKLAASGDSNKFQFPIALNTKGNLNFSFSGLKTAVFYKLKSLGLVNAKAEPIDNTATDDSTRADIAASFQKAVISSLVNKTVTAALEARLSTVVVGGGVIANGALRQNLITAANQNHFQLHMAPVQLATDNALSMAGAAHQYFNQSRFSAWRDIEANANLHL